MDLDCKELERLKELVPYKILAPTPNEIINYIEKLQSNWNSLKEIIKDLGIDYLLDKMNELEGKNKDNGR